MSTKLVIKQCKNCMTTVKVIKEECNIMCCGEEMKELIPNSVDAAIEKHVPNYEVKDGKIIVTVNHVMEEDHYIEWISMCSEDKKCTVYFKPGNVAKAEFKYIPGSTIYAYCNKHGLWKKDVE